MARLLVFSGVFLALCMTTAVAKGQEKDFFPGIPDIKYEVGLGKSQLFNFAL